MTHIPTSSDRESIRAAVDKALDAAIACGIALVRNALKKRTHRTPNDQAVESTFQAWFLSNDFREFFARETLPLLRDIESELGRPGRDWSLQDHQLASERVAAYFRRLRSAFERKRGRPIKRSHRRGIIGSRMLASLPARRKSENDKLRQLEGRLLAFVDGAKLRAFAKRETRNKADARSRFPTIEAVRKHMTDWGINPSEVSAQRLPAGTIEAICKYFGIDQRQKAALKQRLYRARRRP